MRRGAIEARASSPDIRLWDVDASETSGRGVILGEHALMAKAQCICSYRAMTHCELYQLGVDDLYKIAQRYMVEEREADGRDESGRPVDEMAEIIYAEFARRHLLRALSLRMMLMKRSGGGRGGSVGSDGSSDGSGGSGGGVSSGGGAKPQGRFSGSTSETQETAALRIQAIWVHRAAKGMLRGDKDLRSISSLVPGLYFSVRGARGGVRRRRSLHEAKAAGGLVAQRGDSPQGAEDAGSTARSTGSEQEAVPLTSEPLTQRREQRSEQFVHQPSAGGGGSGGIGHGVSGAELQQVHLERILKAHEARLEEMMKAAVTEAVAKAVAGLQQVQKV